MEQHGGGGGTTEKELRKRKEVKMETKNNGERKT